MRTRERSLPIELFVMTLLENAVLTQTLTRVRSIATCNLCQEVTGSDPSIEHRGRKVQEKPFKD